MKGRITFGLLCVVVLAFACGPRASTGDSAGAIRTSRTSRARSSAPNGPALVSALHIVVKNGVAMDFRVMNAGTKRLEVNFPSGQTHEVVVVDSLGREVFRWSKGRMFTQSLQNKVLHASDTLDYDAVWQNAPAGKYTAIATLASENFPMEQRAEFVVR
jgi:Intracellular proteinase inhibitor